MIARGRGGVLTIGLFSVVALSGCGPTVVAEYTKPYSEATAEERQMEVGWAVIECVVRSDRTADRCRVVEASPDTAEVRDLALQGIRMHGVPDLPNEATAGDVVRRRIRVAIHD